MRLLVHTVFLICNLQTFSLCLLGFVLIPGGIIGAIFNYKITRSENKRISKERFDPWSSFEIEFGGYCLCFAAFSIGIKLILVNCFC